MDGGACDVMTAGAGNDPLTCGEEDSDIHDKTAPHMHETHFSNHLQQLSFVYMFRYFISPGRLFRASDWLVEPRGLQRAGSE